MCYAPDIDRGHIFSPGFAGAGTILFYRGRGRGPGPGQVSDY